MNLACLSLSVACRKLKVRTSGGYQPRPKYNLVRSEQKCINVILRSLRNNSLDKNGRLLVCVLLFHKNTLQSAGVGNVKLFVLNDEVN